MVCGGCAPWNCTGAHCTAQRLDHSDRSVGRFQACSDRERRNCRIGQPRADAKLRGGRLAALERTGQEREDRIGVVRTRVLQSGQVGHACRMKEFTRLQTVEAMPPGKHRHVADPEAFPCRSAPDQTARTVGSPDRAADGCQWLANRTLHHGTSSIWRHRICAASQKHSEVVLDLAEVTDRKRVQDQQILFIGIVDLMAGISRDEQQSSGVDVVHHALDGHRSAP